MSARPFQIAIPSGAKCQQCFGTKLVCTCIMTTRIVGINLVLHSLKDPTRGTTLTKLSISSCRKKYFVQAWEIILPFFQFFQSRKFFRIKKESLATNKQIRIVTITLVADGGV